MPFRPHSPPPDSHSSGSVPFRFFFFHIGLQRIDSRHRGRSEKMVAAAMSICFSLDWMTLRAVRLLLKAGKSVKLTKKREDRLSASPLGNKRCLLTGKVSPD